MKRFLIALAVIMTAAAAQATDVGVSISVGQPGFYGRIDIGDFPPPQVIYRRPVVVLPPHATVVEEPLYLHVPPGHAKNWRKHCHKYDACGRPVYFVKNRWYSDVYVPQYRERHERRDRRPDRGHGADRDRDKDRGHGR
jgi:hypothetical protein